MSEDIDKARNEVQSLLLPLLEGSSSFTTGHGEVFSYSQLLSLLRVEKFSACLVPSLLQNIKATLE